MSETAGPAPPRLAVVAFAATVAVSAALLFAVQPMLGKVLLPAYGGGAAVWTAVMLFFQIGLLAGSGLFHAVSTLFGGGAAAAVHLCLAVLGVLLVPVVPVARETGLGPTIDVLATLAAAYGPVVLVLGANAAALQAWYARAVGQAPWWLYAVSNAGSFFGLLAYPLLIESAFTLHEQGALWVRAFAVCAAGLAACAWMALRRPARRAEGGSGTPVLRLDWLILAALPSSLLLGVTEHITVVVAPLPMLWVLPLAAYLASWILAFAHPEGAARCGRLMVMALCLPVLFEFQQPVISIELPALAVALHVAGLLGAGLMAHGMLAQRRPPAATLTGFYLNLSLGGAIGGLVNAVVAPLLLDRAIEYLFVFGALLLLVPVGRDRGAKVIWGLMAALVAFSPYLAPRRDGTLVAHARDFYGTVTVIDTAGQRQMAHGRTVHGFEWLDPARRLEPSSYYHRDAGAGRLITTMLELRPLSAPPMNAVLVGLGPGTMACYASDRFRPTFVEISPAVVASAQRWFGFLSGCGSPPVEIGDGRLRLLARPPGSIDLIVIDAYSGVSIPVHMATAEATAQFLDRLAPGGAMTVHVSTPHFDLAPLVAAAAREAGARALMLERVVENVPSSWITVTRDEALSRRLADEGWAPIPPAARPWRDDRWDLLSAIRR
ncbi:polyamine aminopropyltransferase [Neoroseomonas soli]|uniref:Spermidine synthase n=1 Tax=Neoroseomonas soli TaxID=1081025 RepID=A0A9X9X236_9PROT|nr:hypothetical protein [Neoroseomonas soli]MBR0673465.1 hypothetical protein [Neoroseomonas soli]